MMKKLAMALAFATCTVIGPGIAPLQARQPLYLILRAPARTHAGRAYYPGRSQKVRADTYAYGWFGVRPRQHAKRSTGYHGRYIEWAKQ
ncbi:MAG: hypothetical protein ACQESR_03100 [Planctomycetota bacterium]